MTRTTTQTKSRHRAETPAEWLEELGGALRMPYERAEAIREELAEHLRERVRDLELEGLDEAAAASAAVRELGDAAAVARRFRNADKTPIRRRIMNLAVIGIAGAALVTSVVAISGESSPGESPRALVERAITGMQDEQAQTGALLHLQAAIVELDEAGPSGPAGAGGNGLKAGPAPVRGELPLLSMMFARRETSGPPIAVEGLQGKDTRLDDVLKWVGAQAGATPVVRWMQMEAVGIGADETVTIQTGPTDLATMMTVLNEARGVFGAMDEGMIEYRMKDGVIEFAPRTFFDQREATVVWYDIERLLNAGIELEEVTDLITRFVEPDHWEENGGDLAFMQVVGGKMFVKAPPRMQEGVKWFIEQLATPES